MRCTDAATGRVTYTDGACIAGESARQVQAQRSAHELAQEREQAAQAQARVQQERQQREERELQEQQRRAQAALRAPAPPSAPGPAASAACARARQQLQQALASPNPGLYDEQLRLHNAQGQVELACLTADEQARAWAARSPATAAPQVPLVVVAPPRRPLPPPPAAPRRDYTSCNVFRCYDRQGNAHPR